MKNTADIRWIECLEDYFWSAFNQGVAIGNTNPENTYAYGGVEKGEEEETMALYSILDTGTSALNFSYHFYDDFIAKIFEYVGGDDYVV